MANTPKAHLVTVVRLYDEDSSDYIELLMNDSAPSGAADPWASTTARCCTRRSPMPGLTTTG